MYSAVRKQMIHEEFWLNPNRFRPLDPRIQFHAYFESTMKPGGAISTRNYGYAIYTFITQGEVTITRNGESAVLSKNDFLTPHFKEDPDGRFESTGKVPLKRRNFMIHRNRLHDAVLSEMFHAGEVVRLKDITGVGELLDDIQGELSREVLPDEQRLAGLFFQMLHELCRQHRSNPYPSELNAALNYINKNYISGPIVLDSVARFVGISVRNLERLFRTHVNSAVGEYILRLRLEQAKSLLSIPTALRIKEVSDACGFTDVNLMSRQFKQKYGTSPRNWRNRIGKSCGGPFSGQSREGE